MLWFDSPSTSYSIIDFYRLARFLGVVGLIVYDMESEENYSSLDDYLPICLLAFYFTKFVFPIGYSL